MLLAPLHFLPMQDQATVWFFACLWICWGAYRESRRILVVACPSAGDWPAGPRRGVTWFGVATVAAVVLPTLNCLQRGQVTIVVLYLLLLGLRLVLTGRTSAVRLLGGIVLALPVTIKIIPLLPVAFLLFIQLAGCLQQRWRRQPMAAQLGRQWAVVTSGVGLGLLLFFFLLPALLIGWNANLRHLDTWSNLVLSNAGKSTATPGFEKDTHSVRNQCLGNALYRLGNFSAYMVAGGPEDPLVNDNNPPPRLMDSPCVNTCLLFVRVTLLLALLLAGVRLGGHSDVLLCQAAGFGLACAALLVVSPVARNHYFLLLTPAVLFVPLWLDGRGGSRAAGILAVVPGVLIVLAVCLAALCWPNWPAGPGDHRLAYGRDGADGQSWGSRATRGPAGRFCRTARPLARQSGLGSTSARIAGGQSRPEKGRNSVGNAARKFPARPSGPVLKAPMSTSLWPRNQR